MNMEIAFHGVEILILLFGVALPMIKSSQRLRSILQDYPPHRHINGSILYPPDYQPAKVEKNA